MAGERVGMYSKWSLGVAYTALAKTLADAGVLDMDHLFTNLAGARAQLDRIGETGVANALGSMAENLTSI